MDFLRRRCRAPPPGVQSLRVITITPDRRSVSLSSSSDEDTPAQNGESSGSSSGSSGASLPPLEGGSLFPHILNPPKPDVGHKECECGICGDAILVAERPRFPSSYAQPSSSDTNPDSTPAITGISMPCYNGHNYCFSCISTHIKTILADASFKAVFPIRCPECTWPIQDPTAEKILTKEEMEGMWYWAKVFQEVRTFYCPIGTCGARVELPPEECSRGLRRAECPACQESFCFRCQVKWHEGQTCAKYARTSGALNLDKALQKLAKKQKWRRCPKCRIVVERNFGLSKLPSHDLPMWIPILLQLWSALGKRLRPT
ncbi:hypothetical protein M407DRAFT_32201 [Tulasnella calospora MUT 4182]|uniref:RBR-type E3 ubiquitin transferase n=1 Tax=Tulasnella calospora MUT 4182 TaxID=1051891 RepID=A0A0C3Q4E1_9AGAM|nr:hypothetical protein M407DRAFT_32201 [Tulasnella calospora MUT 4182]